MDIDSKYNIKTLREIKGWSPEKVASEIGVSHATIKNWEAYTMDDDREITLRHLMALCKLFNVPAADIVRNPEMKKVLSSAQPEAAAA